MLVPVAHRTLEIDGVEMFYREAGPPDAPIVLLPHGYPCSSFQFRHLMPALGDRWRLLAPDLPAMRSGCTTTARSSDCAWPCARPSASPRSSSKNGDIYEDELGPKYEVLKAFWANPTPQGREQLAANVSEAGFRDEFAGQLPAHLAARVSPDLWKLHWALMDTPRRRAGIVRLFEDQGTTLADFPAQQAYLREHQPPTPIVWGPHDGYMPEASARA